jgi:EmrB/QacA subfamily drug resistance transporter
MLITARAVQGAGAALVLPLAMTLLSAAFPPERRAKALGIFSGVTGLAVLGGPVVGGAVTEGIAWQWIFWLNVPIGLLAIPLVLARIERTPATSAGRLDFGGLLLIAGGAFGLVWGLARANTVGWSSAEVIGALIAGAVVTIAFVAWELRTPAPMLPMRLFRARAFSAANTAGFFLNASLTGAVFLMAQFLQTSQGDGPLGAGLRLLPWTSTLFMIAPIAGTLVQRIGERRLIVTGLLLQTVGMAWIALIADPGRAYPAFIAPMIIAGCGVSMVFPASQNAVVNAVSPTMIGPASGTYNMLRQLGGVFGVAILVAVFAEKGGYTSPSAFSDGFAPAIGVAAGLAFIGAIAGALTPKHAPEPKLPPAPAPQPAPAETATP